MVGGLFSWTEPVTVPFIFLALLYLAYLSRDTLNKFSLQMVIAVVVFAATIAPCDFP